MRLIFTIIIWPLAFAPLWLPAQTPPVIPPGGLIQLQVQQPVAEMMSSATATAVFDPPVVHIGEKSFYRVNLDSPEASIQWPGKIPLPAELSKGRNTHGQIMRQEGNKFRPLAAFVQEVTTTATGQFTITNLTVMVSGQPVEIPAATVRVVDENSNLPLLKFASGIEKVVSATIFAGKICFPERETS